jgi:hypothetical protein
MIGLEAGTRCVPRASDRGLVLFPVLQNGPLRPFLIMQ